MRLKIIGSVGLKGKNNQDDVRVISALLNVWLRSKKKKVLPISIKVSESLSSAILSFQQDELKLKKPDGRVDPNGRSWKGLISTLKETRTKVAISKPKVGWLTFDAEGQEGGIYHSRILHVPSAFSGLTIGRGFDMKERKQAAVASSLSSCGIESSYAVKVSKGARKSGQDAFNFIIKEDLLDWEISAPAQLKLFEIVYKEQETEVKRICNLKAVIKEYGTVDWDKLDQKIKDVLVDLKYRGDYKPSTRKFLQVHVAKNDLESFSKAICDQSKWKSVPNDRFQRRVAFLKGK
ncbi:hypothetical protein ACFOEK_18110 [Litoribrevibacter euphylliae]|uniref:Uncharacterized protein n=1 Tax=Litoribrevibacter euphylliae TaxID=1834034 RepID=A0ABV7HLD2_9GAMM